MLMPKRVKYRKKQRGRLRGLAHRGNEISFGTYGLQAVESHYITSRQIEAARRAIMRYIRRGGKVWIRVFPDKPFTKRAAETRMGSGKGNVEHWIAAVRPGKVLFEIAGVREELAREAMRLAAHKLPMRTQFVAREDHGA
ncbi:MAG: 50S ribosomal protein L16 [Caldilineaceae bacterium]|nr:50S ribosomal protein L16 [Caldilineaceae bacterium]MCB9147619.1 50S ribosomal protein L16 [Caldilineaceae bacterium]